MLLCHCVELQRAYFGTVCGVACVLWIMPYMTERDLFWQAELRAFGFSCKNGKRLNKIARIIAKNGFRNPAKLRFAAAVEKWLGTEDLSLSEVAELQRFAKAAGQRGGKRGREDVSEPSCDVVAQEAEVVIPEGRCDGLAVQDAPVVSKLALPARVAGVGGPRRAFQALQKVVVCEKDRQEWMHAARIAAILGSAPRSLDKLECGLRLWFDFHDKLGGPEWGPALPPCTAALLAWSCTFRCEGTWVHYLGHVKTGVSFPLFVCAVCVPRVRMPIGASIDGGV